ncbi:MFS general substrate transporter [Myriangium duriaei CBS 260.36]|uniref:MFS general substrate transporter n=1 Tax=Myriangium duriaei CBS 260.36 TaxID=1168546 RepID=A0A9P4MGX9_9PEZI|nr:MFS general substrate transporter [Myriangium duriaei CBS 260.36]
MSTEIGLQVDLAKSEAPARQVIEHTSESFSATLQPIDADANGHALQPPKRASRGSISPVYQIQPLHKASRAGHRASLSTVDSDAFKETDTVVELQPVDGGFGAWSYVAAAFSMYIVIWGFPQAFPIFQTYLSTGPNARFSGSVAIRLLAPGLQDIEEGLLFPMLPTNTKFRRPLVLVGIFIITTSLLLASYAQTDWHIVLLQGVTFGIGGILMNFVHVCVFAEWFDKKKGQAMGIIWTGWRVGALSFPLACQWLLDQHGFEQTLRVLIAPMLTFLAPAIVLLRGRFHSATISVQPVVPPLSKLQALRAPSVLYYLVATSLFFMVVNVPKMFITTFAADLGMKGQEQAVTLVLLVLSDMLGTYLCGWLSDSVNHEAMTALSAVSTSVTHILGLGFARDRSGVFLYAVAVGLTSGGFSNCLFNFFGDLSKGDGRLFTAIHGLFSFFRGAAILSVGPVGAALLDQSPPMNPEFFGSTRYQVSGANRP